MSRGLGTRFSTVIVVLTVCFLLAGLALNAKGKLDFIAKFQTGEDELDVATYIDPAAESTTNKVAILGFRSRSVRNSFASNLGEWNALIQLWKKATQLRSSPSSDIWKFVGSLTENGTTDVSQLTISAGAGIKLAVSSPNGASLSYALAKAETARFDKALVQAKDFLSK